MADKKITEYTTLTAPNDADLTVVVDDVAGTPTTKKITLANLLKDINITGAISVPTTSKISLDGAGATTYLIESANDVLDIYTGNVKALTIDSNQDVAIAATKKFYFDGGNDTYFSETAADTLKLYTGGNERMLWGGGYMKYNNALSFSIRTGVATLAAPSYSFTGDENTGLQSGAADEISLVTGAVTAITYIENTGVLQKHQINAGLTADVGSVQGGTPLTSSYNEISTCANVGDVVTLPTAVAGLKVTIINNGANACDVFPASDDDCGGGANTAVSLAVGANITYFAIDVTNWEVI